MAETPQLIRHESPVFVPAGEHMLFGVITEPTERPAATVIIASAGNPTWVHRSPFPVETCRRLAASGFRAVRFDFRGVGESGGMVRRFELADPLPGDLLAVSRMVEGLDQAGIIPVGFCFGSRTVLAAAEYIDRLEAAVLIAPPLHEKGTARFAARWNVWQFARRALRLQTLRGLFDSKRRAVYRELVVAKWRRMADRTNDHSNGGRPGPRGREDSWVSPRFFDALVRLLDRRVPILVIYGEDDEEYGEFRRARSGRLGQMLDQTGPQVEVVVRPGRVHSFDDASVQDALTELISDWLSRRVLPKGQGLGG
jgi:pimeloyl-ACP methyl ester carboxylesterase